MERSSRRRTAKPDGGNEVQAGLTDLPTPPHGCAAPGSAPDRNPRGARVRPPPRRGGNEAGSSTVLAPLWRRDGVTALHPLDLTQREREIRDLIRPDFDASYYLLTNQDVCDAAIDPLHHYVRSGRFEGRRPAHWFDPAHYRASYQEADDSGSDPFSYFLRFGRAQGHTTTRRNAAARSAVAAARVPGAHGPPTGPGSVVHLHPSILLHELRAQLSSARGLTVAVSHDRYLQSVGGIQVLVADEQAAFNARGEAYLHLAPAVPMMTLAPDGPGPHYLHATMNGAYLGAATGTELLAALQALAPDLPDVRRFVVHCLFGHSVAVLVALYACLQAPRDQAPPAVFWVHDYGTICVGHNLLRNDASFCDAPPPGSAACGICVYGGQRPAHLASVHALFRSIPFHVAAPSAAALALWQRRAGLPHRSAVVAPVLRTDITATRRRLAGGPGHGSPADRICVAFAGHPVPHKGWHAFVQIAAELRRSGAYRLLHLSSCGDPGLPGVGHVPVRVTPADPDSMTAAMMAAGVDLVLVLSPWPETFCIVASEALAAGADILTLECSGNVANLVRQTGRSKVFAGVDDVAAYLASTEAILDVRRRDAAGADVGQVRLLGATAALALPGDDDPDAAGAAWTAPAGAA
ncbi:MAG TPA: hypothetical protein VGC15_21520 [Acetobacteraceae bacterium]